MMYFVWTFVIIGICFFFAGIVAREPSPDTYDGERLADQIIMWLICGVIEFIALILYLMHLEF